MNGPKLACPNLFPDVVTLKSFAFDYGFQGIDWTLRPGDLPKNHLEEAQLIKALSRLAPLEVRFHLFFPDNELGDVDVEKAASAANTLYAALDLISKLSGRFSTVHVGLGRESMEDISWERTIDGLTDLRARARESGIRLCLENLAWGWTGRPELYEKLIRKTNCWGTLDIGHAQVCPSVTSQAYNVQDFAFPHPERILGAHIYHEETAAGHLAPGHYSDLEDRLRLLRGLPLCDWWVLELRDEKSLLQTLDCVRGFLQDSAARVAI
ncbi:MAG: TIM barrel protein [Desulfomonile tiedjei]|uniref:TIM barrel protein n=1 Tax=Desulfomonile tiedjei TaxID=2358 RepID=A0A9D6V3Z1_9BACT|nr:TIM barrel protein [Desulfomonile tiedjei]